MLEQPLCHARGSGWAQPRREHLLPREQALLPTTANDRASFPRQKKENNSGAQNRGKKETQVRTKWAESWHLHTDCTAPASTRSCRRIIACAAFEFPSWCDLTYKDVLNRCKWMVKQAENGQNRTPVSMQRHITPHTAKYLCFVFVLGCFDTWNCS